MNATHYGLPAEVTTVDVHLAYGDVSLHAAPAGAQGSVVAESSVRAETRGSTLLLRQQAGWPSGVALQLPATVTLVRCSTGSGDLTIEGVDATVDARTGRGEVSLAAGGGRAAVETGKGEVRVSGWRGPLRLRTGKGNVEATAVGGDLSIWTGSGDVNLDDVAGRVQARTGNGSVVAGRVGGEVGLRTEHGDVVATDLAGARLEASTGHGEVALGGRLRGLRASTGRGEIVCRCALEEGSFELRSSNGDITLVVPAGQPLRVDAATSHGRIETSLPLVKVGRPGPEGAHSQRLVGAVGPDPKAIVLIRTARGDIEVGQAGEARLADAERRCERDEAAAPDQTATERAWRETLRAFGLGEREARLEVEGAVGLGAPAERLRASVEERVGSALAGVEAQLAELDARFAEASRGLLGAGAAGAPPSDLQAEDEAEGIEELVEQVGDPGGEVEDLDDELTDLQGEIADLEGEVADLDADRREAEGERGAAEQAQRERALAERRTELGRRQAELAARQGQIETRGHREGGPAGAEWQQGLAKLATRPAEALARVRERLVSPRREAVAAPAPARGGEVGSSPGESELRVLQAVSRGEISVDEAMALLARLEGRG